MGFLSSMYSLDILNAKDQLTYLYAKNDLGCDICCLSTRDKEIY